MTGVQTCALPICAKLQGIMSHHLSKTAQALVNHDDVAVKLREIDVALNGRLDGLEGAIDRSAGNIESLTEEMIKLAEPDENRLDAEYQRMMAKIETTIERDAVAQEPIAVNATGARPAGAPQTAAAAAAAGQNIVTTPTSTTSGNADSIGEMRDKLTGAYGRGKDQEV